LLFWYIFSLDEGLIMKKIVIMSAVLFFVSNASFVAGMKDDGGHSESDDKATLELPTRMAAFNEEALLLFEAKTPAQFRLDCGKATYKEICGVTPPDRFLRRRQFWDSNSESVENLKVRFQKTLDSLWSKKWCDDCPHTYLTAIPLLSEDKSHDITLGMLCSTLRKTCDYGLDQLVLFMLTPKDGKYHPDWDDKIVFRASRWPLPPGKHPELNSEGEYTYDREVTTTTPSGDTTTLPIP
jgi:hypothetical protein